MRRKKGKRLALPRAHYRMVEAVHRMLAAASPPPRHVLAAVSGGSDSCALLVLLAQARALGDHDLTACYVDHRLRPETATEARHVARLAEEQAVRFVSTTIPVPADRSEAALRNARYAALTEVMDDVDADCIATGHTRDDQIETVLFRLLRGSGRAGLSAMRPHRDHVVRPLLGFDRESLRTLLSDLAVEWCEDPSNSDLRYTRNRLRHTVVPMLAEQLGKGRLDHLAELAERFAEEDAYLEEQAERFAAYAVRGHAGHARLDLAAFGNTPLALRPRLLRRWLVEIAVPGEVGSRQIAELERFLESSTATACLDLAGSTLERDRDCLRLSQSGGTLDYRFVVEPDRAATFEDPDGRWRIDVDPRPHGRSQTDFTPARQVMDIPREAVAWPMLLRPHATADSIAPIDEGLPQSVHDIMVDRRVPTGARRGWPVLAAADGIVWIPGLTWGLGLAPTRSSAQKVRFGWQRLDV